MRIDENQPDEKNENGVALPGDGTPLPQTTREPTSQATRAEPQATLQAPQESTPPPPMSPAVDASQKANEPPRPRRRGFAAMDRDRVKAIASKGGRAAHAAGTAHQFNSDEARVAGKKGGMAPHVRRGGVRRRPTDNATSSTSIGEPQNRGQSHGDRADR
jgi:uncharacterized protein